MQNFDVKLICGRTDELANERTKGWNDKNYISPDIIRMSGVYIEVNCILFIFPTHKCALDSP